MLNKKKKAFSISYFVLGLILFLPVISYADQAAVQDKKSASQIIAAQDNSPRTPSIRRLFNLKEGKASLASYSDIAIPVGPIASTSSNTQAQEDSPKGGSK